ncbi:MAG: cytochrome c biogenesis protein CcsA [Isosphaeraceae bacterium]|nr:cytochrome c biogenesis protein CcsA [Isosphaeraceae bacterium]
MRRSSWLFAGLALALLAGAQARAAEKKAPTVGVGPAYEAVGKIPVLHEGRDKPIDTLAREEVKQIFGRETITLHDAENKDVAKWGPVAALIDWSVRPEFWDDQAIILVEYVPLKRLLLADTIAAQLTAIAEKSTTVDADKSVLRTLASDKALTAERLTSFLKSAKLPESDAKAVAGLAATLSESHKWLSPRELEHAKVTVDGQSLPFDLWFQECAQRNRRANADPTGKIKLNTVERRAIEVGTRLVHYQAIRDREFPSVEPLLIAPRPHNAKYLSFLKALADKARKQGDARGLSPLELDSLKSLDTYWKDLPDDQRKDPGTDAEFDKEFSLWLRDSSAWVPLRVLLDATPEQLEEAGYPPAQVTAFRAAFKDLQAAEEAKPGEVDAAKGQALLTAARDLGQSINDVTYPGTKIIELETYFNEMNPFWKAPTAYGTALFLLAISLMFPSKKGSPVWGVGVGVYVAGLLALLTGIALEIYGFSMRVRISGWAPVTNMYETVIWVALIAAILSFVFELIFRKKFIALAGSGSALLGTILAANVPLLDPNLHSLQPVLRSNYWLTIHVLTEVSSYAAFALAWMLGMIAVGFYLTATYRRSPRPGELAWPLVAGAPVLLLGVCGLAATSGLLGPKWEFGQGAAYVATTFAAVGGFFSIVGLGALAGEAVSKLTFREEALLDTAALAGEEEYHAAAPATAVQTVMASEGSTTVATLSKPTVAEIRARAAQSRPKLDARGRAMQETAQLVKQLSTFIYWTMFVGVILITAGTILGGVWADYSWGRFWGWDPKEVWALITLLVYLAPLHGRFAGWINTFGLVMASIVCFLSVVMAWYGVNFVLGVGLHSYGFVEGGGQMSVGAVILAVLAVAGAAAWRRHLGLWQPKSAI